MNLPSHQYARHGIGPARVGTDTPHGDARTRDGDLAGRATEATGTTQG